MSLTQKFFKVILPGKWFEKIRYNSEHWFFTCDCGYQISVWETGGIRGYATGNKVVVGRCAGCGKVKPLKLVWKD
jgi:hypothetical protein